MGDKESIGRTIWQMRRYGDCDLIRISSSSFEFAPLSSDRGSGVLAQRFSARRGISTIPILQPLVRHEAAEGCPGPSSSRRSFLALGHDQAALFQIESGHRLIGQPRGVGIGNKSLIFFLPPFGFQPHFAFETAYHRAISCFTNQGPGCPDNF
ncbi:MAG: hypothetical protein CBC48_17290 [bacterium TMED88]|nr:hypothetical protein [Deltaproteobacteria bacterium]OUV24708.1 MAG: hypothetical protein CBC48_17290 [bacterium TMED88]